MMGIATLLLLVLLETPCLSSAQGLFQDVEEVFGGQGPAENKDVETDAGLCPAVPKFHVEGSPHREYKFGCHTRHHKLVEYLTEVVGQTFDPPISFYPENAPLYFQTSSVEESLALNYDFMVTNAYRGACFETEGNTIPLATEVRADVVNITEFGAVLYTLKNRTDIRTMEDIKGKKVGSNKIDNLATHLCYDVMLRNGVHNLQDPEQIIYFKNSRGALDALLLGQVDLACAATGTLETHKHPVTGLPLDLAEIHVLNQVFPISNGEKFPHLTSSKLVAYNPVVAFPQVEEVVVKRVQKELFAIGDHADAAPALLACLEGRGCATNNTECLHTCFDSLPYGTVRNCDTTPQLALKAFEAVTAGKNFGYVKARPNLPMRDILETTGFLVKDPYPRCIRLDNIAEAVTCPPGHFVRTSQEIIGECSAKGLECYDFDCFCRYVKVIWYLGFLHQSQRLIHRLR